MIQDYFNNPSDNEEEYSDECDIEKDEQEAVAMIGNDKNDGEVSEPTHHVECTADA